MFNPSIAVNGLFLAGVEAHDGVIVGLPPGEDEPPVGPRGKGETFGTGLSVQEVEVQFKAAVDPYFDATMVFAIPGVEGIEIEEGYVVLTAVPRLHLTVGKFKQAFGRENLAHTHALLTVDRSLVAQRVLGGEGLNDMAVGAAVLLPAPWFSELTVSADAGSNDFLYGSGLPGGLGTMAHWKNVLDLSPSATAELGVSGATGLNAFDGRSWAGGLDLTVKAHGRARHQWRRVVWQTELMFARRDGARAQARLGGVYSTLEYAIDRRWWIGARGDHVGFGVPPVTAATLIGVFTPTEFSAVRVQAQRQFLPEGHTADSVVAQLVFTMGSHPAHAY